MKMEFFFYYQAKPSQIGYNGSAAAADARLAELEDMLLKLLSKLEPVYFKWQKSTRLVTGCWIGPLEVILFHKPVIGQVLFLPLGIKKPALEYLKFISCKNKF